MYNPITGDDDDEYVELYNSGSMATNLSGWRLADGIDFTFPANTILAPDSFLVVAKNAAELQSKYSLFSGVLGNYTGSLKNSGERIQLLRGDGVLMDEVTYSCGGRWGLWSDGGGSSLELIDPLSDNSLPSNWADSDEAAKSTWTLIGGGGTLRDGMLPESELNTVRRLEIILLGAGECLVDDVLVVNPVLGNRLTSANSDFESGINDWVAEGNHEFSTTEQPPPGGLGGHNSSRSYHLRSSGRGDYLANRVTVPLNTFSANTPGTFQIAAHVRWLRGHPEIVFRLRGNYLETSGETADVGTLLLGTPGARNSVTAVSVNLRNTGPAIYDVAHSPVMPRPGTAVLVTARFHDRSTLASESPQLKFRRVDITGQGSEEIVLTMNDSGILGDAKSGDGVFTGRIPGQSTMGAMFGFSIEATDTGSPSMMSRFPTARAMYPLDPEQRFCLVRWGEPEPGGTLGGYHIWMTKATFDKWSDTSGRVEFHNGNLDTTVAYGVQPGVERAIYNVGAHFAGSAFHSVIFNNPTGNDCGYVCDIPPDDRFLGSISVGFEQDASSGHVVPEQVAYWMQSQFGIPSTHRRYANLFVNGVLRSLVKEDAQQPNSDHIESWFPNDPNGDLYRLEVWWNDFFFADITGAGGFPIGVGGSPINGDSSFLLLHATLEKFPPSGDADNRNKARYRWNWLKRAIRGSADDFGSLFTLIEALHTRGSNVYGAQIDQVIDIDEWTRAFALTRILDNGDQYSFGNGHNMFAYKPTMGKWCMIPVDQDDVFVCHSGPNCERKPIFEPYVDPVLSKFIHNPLVERAYWRAMDDAVKGFLLSSRVNSIFDDKVSALRGNGVDPGSVDAFKSFIVARRHSLQTNIANIFTNYPFGITRVAGGAVQNPVNTADNPVVVEGSGPLAVKTINVNNLAYPITWLSITNWRVAVPLTAIGLSALNFKAFSAQGGPVGPPAGVTVNANYTGTFLPGAHPRINEWMAQNTLALSDPADGDYDDWIEIYNPSNVVVNFSGYSLRCVPASGSPMTWTVPANVIIPPGGFLLVWMDDEGNQNGRNGPNTDLHASFGLGANDMVELYAPGVTPPAPPLETVTVSVGTPTQNFSNGRFPDGQGAPFLMAVPTPRVANHSAQHPPPLELLVINEWMALNGGLNVVDPSDGNANDWIEIRNTGPSPIELTGFMLTDDLNIPGKWVFPPGVTIPAGGFLLIWADNETHQFIPQHKHPVISSRASTGYENRIGSLEMLFLQSALPEALAQTG